MKNPCLLIGSNKTEKECCFTFKKSKRTYELLNNLIVELKTDLDLLYLSDFLNKKETDSRFNYKDKKMDIDIFIGSKKIILVLRTSKDRQEEISKKLFKFVDFIK